MSHVRRLGAIVVACVVAVGLVAGEPAPAPRAIAGSWQFKAETVLAIGLSGEGGLRLDSVLFRLPATAGTVHARTGGLTTVDVAVSNTGPDARRVGLAIALFDADQRLVGAASGGSGLVRLRPGRQKTFRLVFEGAYAELSRATLFYVALETTP